MEIGLSLYSAARPLWTTQMPSQFLMNNKRKCEIDKSECDKNTSDSKTDTWKITHEFTNGFSSRWRFFQFKSSLSNAFIKSCSQYYLLIPAKAPGAL